MPKSEFPNEYLVALEQNHRKKVEASSDPAERLLMYSGARLNWVGEYINDESIHWKLETVPVDSLTLTGTGPEWNAITLDRAEGNPAKLRELLKTPEIRQMFESSQYVDIPILVRREEDKLKILDGMNRTIAAVRDNIPEIRAYIGTRDGNPTPIVEPHIVYDFIRAYEQRGGNEEDLKGGLRFLLNAYSNVRELLETRFDPKWVRDEKMQQIIKEVLGK
jgi:hypothetical protein